jgi:uncharacterized protein YodC (DUF2158 family)
MVQVRQGQNLGDHHGKEAEQTDEADVQALKGRQEGLLMTFKEGDVVSRKIGGPLMTVEERRHDDLVCVVWIDADGHVQRDVFAQQTLNKWRLAED